MFKNILRGKTNCPFCGNEYEFMTISSEAFGEIQIPKKCSCELASATESEKSSDDLKNKALMDIAALIELGPQGRFERRTFENFKTEINWQKELLIIAKKFTEEFIDDKVPSQGLVLVGRNGIGKTHVTAAIYHYLKEKNIPVIFGTVNHLFNMIKKTYDRNTKVTMKQTESRLMELYTTVPLLIIDDLGKEYLESYTLYNNIENAYKTTWSWGLSKLYEIINCRYENDLPILVTTNIDDLSILTARTDSGIISRLLEMCDWIRIDSKKDLRVIENKNRGNNLSLQ